MELLNSASKERAEWHLIPTGWIRGSQRVDYQGTSTLDPPTDRVLTCKYGQYLFSSFSSLDKDVSILWQSDDKDKIACLIGQYGDCPRHL